MKKSFPDDDLFDVGSHKFWGEDFYDIVTDPRYLPTERQLSPHKRLTKSFNAVVADKDGIKCTVHIECTYENNDIHIAPFKICIS